MPPPEVYGFSGPVRVPLSLTVYKEGDVKEKPWATVDGLTLGEDVRIIQFWFLCLLFFFFLFSVDTILAHIVPHSTDLGIPATSAANILAITVGSTLVGRLTIATVLDKIGNRLAILISFVTLSLAMIWLLIADRTWMFFLFAVVLVSPMVG